MEDPTAIKIKSFTDLKVWQVGHRLVICIYKITRDFPREETYSLIDQMRRSSSSVTSNVAEGFGRQTLKEKVQFYFQAKGSLTELKDQILIARDVGYLKESDLQVLIALTNDTGKLLQGLISKTRLFINQKSEI